MECRDAIEAIHYFFVSPLSVLFNALALYIIKTHTKTQDLNAYKIILEVTCCLDLLNSAYIFFSDIHARILDQQTVYFILGPIKYLLNDSSELIQMGCQILISNIIMPSFIFRNRRLSNEGVFLLYLICFSPPIVFITLYTYLGVKYNSDVTDVVLKSNVCVGEQFLSTYVHSNFTGQFDVRMGQLMNFTVMINMLVYPVILVCGILIVRFLHQNRHLISNQQLQTEITKTLTVQIMLPLLATGLPALVIQTIRLTTTTDTSVYTNYAVLVRSWIPLLNPIIMLYCIRPLRSQVAYYFQYSSRVQDITMG
ncbi:hypothetical protein M3Y97_00928800 [Aphelenchoides bicaudatus]|nr:hypothetical protein M3Y97_00928800 [Aphelenchoides bicaudatus]